jgi:hypothetical protein
MRSYRLSHVAPLLSLVLAGCSSASTRGFHPAPASAGDDASASGDDASSPAAADDGGPSPPSADAGEPPPKCQYPQGPYGIHTNETVDGSFAWQGFVDGAATATEVAMKDFYDCDGSRGINAVLIDTSAVWCGNCQIESSQLQSTMNGTWAGLGVKVLVLMWQNASSGPPSLGDARMWMQTYGLGAGISVVVDDRFTFADPNSMVGLPRNILLDPRTMKIVTEADGQGGNVDQVTAEFAQNNRKH